MTPACCILGVLALLGTLAAEDADRITSHLSTAPRIEVPHTGLAPAVDADPEDPAWTTAGMIPALVVAGDETPWGTEVRLVWHAEALHVRFIAVDPEIHTPFGDTRDADHYQGDVAELFLDPLGDGRQYYEIQVTPRGGVLDLTMLLTAEPLSHADGVLDGSLRKREFWTFRSWDLDGLRHAQRILHDETGQTVGWIVDLAIPATHVMKRRGGGDIVPGTVRANLARYEYPVARADGERQLTAMYWAPVRKGCPHISPLAMGELVLLPAP